MTNKIQTIVGAGITGFFGFIAWLATVPPEQQSGILGALSTVFPIAWQPTIGLWAKLFATASGYWSLYKAAHSGPQTPPVDKPEPGTAEVKSDLKIKSTVKPTNNKKP